MFKLQGRKSACTTCAGSSEILRWLTPFLGPNMDPQKGVQNWITFSFLLLGLCLGPVLGSRFGPKSGVSHRRILLLPAEVLQADVRRTSMSLSVNTCFFSLCVPLCFLYISLLEVENRLQSTEVIHALHELPPGLARNLPTQSPPGPEVVAAQYRQILAAFFPGVCQSLQRCQVCLRWKTDCRAQRSFIISNHRLYIRKSYFFRQWPGAHLIFRHPY